MTVMDLRIVFIFTTCAKIVSLQSPDTYTGTCSTTINNKACQRWDAQTPHAHERGLAGFFPLDDGLQGAANHCRDPDKSRYLWCYTLDPGKRFERCKEDKDCPINVSPYCVGQAVVSMCESSRATGPTVSIDTGEISPNMSASCICHVTSAVSTSNASTISYKQDRGGGVSTLDFCGSRFSNESVDETCMVGGFRSISFNTNGRRIRGCLDITSSVNITVTCYPAKETPKPLTTPPDTVTNAPATATGAASVTMPPQSSQSPAEPGTTAGQAVIYSASTGEIDLAVVIGCSVGGLLLLAIAIFILIFCTRRRRQKDVDHPVKENGNAVVDVGAPAVDYENYPHKDTVVDDPEYIMTPNELYGTGFDDDDIEPANNEEIQPNTTTHNTTPNANVLYSSVMKVEVRDNRIEMYANLSDDEDDVDDMDRTHTPAIYSVVHKQK